MAKKTSAKLKTVKAKLKTFVIVHLLQIFTNDSPFGNLSLPTNIQGWGDGGEQHNTLGIITSRFCWQPAIEVRNIMSSAYMVK